MYRIPNRERHIFDIKIPVSFSGLGALTLPLSIDGTPATPVRIPN
jgi:hypothetical protein